MKGWICENVSSAVCGGNNYDGKPKLLFSEVCFNSVSTGITKIDFKGIPSHASKGFSLS